MSGYIDASIYVIVSAISFVFLKDLCDNLNPVIALFFMSGVAIISFNILGIKKIKATYSICLNNKFLFVIMSASLGLDWTCMLYASYVADPFVAMSGLFIFLAIIGFLRLFWQTKKLSNLFSVALLICSTLSLYFTYKIGSSAHLGYGIALGAIAGICFYIYIASSNILASQKGLTTIQVLATRFWALFIGATFFVPYNGLISILLHNFIPLLIISYGSLIIPIYFNQQAIVKLGSALTSVFISLVPPVIFIFNSLYNHTFVLGNAIVCSIITAALIFPNLMKYIKMSRNK